MLQDISYVCIGKGIRKCCSIDSVSDDQCINTEQFYHKVRLDPYDEYSEDEKTFAGTNADYLKPKPWDAPPPNTTEQEDPDADIDPETILEKQTFSEVSSYHFLNFCCRLLFPNLKF